MGTELQESILDAISVLADKSVNDAKTDRTIECEIVKIQDAKQGIYTVKYTENKFIAHSTNSATYAIGDSVYVLVPQGDFSKNKIIIGTVEASKTFEEISQNRVLYNEVTPNFLDDIGEISLCTYHTEEKNYELVNNYIATLIKPYHTFVFETDIKTDIKDVLQRNTGNYGIKIKIPVIYEGQEDYIERILDTKNILGNVYNLEEYTSQKIYFEFDGINYDKNRKIIITAFVKDFIQNDEITDFDIFFKNIQLKAVEQLTEEEINGTFFDIKCDEGFYFLSGKYTNDKILKPELIKQGESVDIRSYECYWFIEDNSIEDPKSDHYTEIAGPGWRPLNKYRRVGDNNGIPIYEYETLKEYTYAVKQDDIYYRARYRCILLNPNEKLSKEITITNLDKEMTLSLDTDSGIRNYIKNVGDVILKAQITYSDFPNNSLIKYIFHRTDSEGNLINEDQFYKIEKLDEINGDTRTTVISFPVSKIDKINTISCSYILQAPGIPEQDLGTEFITLTTEQTDAYFMTNIENQHIIYKYDANGNAPDLATFDGPFSSRVIKFEPLVLRVIKTQDNIELSTSEYSCLDVSWKVPIHSMFIIDDEPTRTEDGYNYYEGKNLRTLNYHIESLFDNTKKDAVISVSYSLGDKKLSCPPEVNVDIHFIKDGESGTNGSQYSTYITYNGYGYGEIVDGISQKLRVLSIDGVWKKYDENDKLVKDFNYGGNPQFLVKVFKSGHLVPSSDYTVKWTMVEFKEVNQDGTDSAKEKSFRIDEGNGIITEVPSRRWLSSSLKPINIVQATVTILDSSSDAKRAKEVLTAYYPIDAIYFGNNLNGKEPFIPSIEYGFDEVIYDNDFTNPQYNMNNPFKLEIIDDKISFQVQEQYWECSNSFEEKEASSSYERNFIPKSEYAIDKVTRQNNYVAVKAILDKEGTKSVRTEINNELAQLNYNYDLLNAKKEFLSEVSALFNYKECLNKIKNCETFLSYRSKYLLYLQDLYNFAKEIQEIDETYEPYMLMVASVISNVVNANEVDEIDKYEGGEISIPLNNDIQILHQLIYQFNDKIKECEQTYNLLANYSNIENEKDILYNLQININKLPEEIRNISIDSQYTELINFRITLAEIIGNYVNENSIYVNKNAFLIGLEKFKKIFNDYNDLTTAEEELQRNYLEQRNKIEEKLGKNTNIDYYNYQSGRNIEFYVVKPIIIDVNRYGLSTINGWDGNRLYVDENGQYVYAPQFGAGVKNDKNQFTGVIMGKRYTTEAHTNNSNRDDIGLFGYAEGMQSFFLDSKTGSLILGLFDEEQIQLNPGKNRESKIADWTFKKEGFEKVVGDGRRVGLYCDANYRTGVAFEAIGPGETHKQVKIFYDGTLEANGAKLDEATVSGNITANTGYIGGVDGWVIKPGLIQSRDEEITLDAYNNQIKVGSEIWINGDDSTIQLGADSRNVAQIELDGIANQILVGKNMTIDGDDSSITAGNISIEGGTNTISLGNQLKLNGAGSIQIGAGLSTAILLTASDGEFNYSPTIKSLLNTDYGSVGFLISKDNFFVGTAPEYAYIQFLANDASTGKPKLIICGDLYTKAGTIGCWNITEKNLNNATTSTPTDGIFIGDCSGLGISVSTGSQIMAKKGNNFAYIDSATGAFVSGNLNDAIYFHGGSYGLDCYDYNKDYNNGQGRYERNSSNSSYINRNTLYLTTSLNNSNNYTSIVGSGRFAVNNLYLKNTNTDNYWVTLYGYITIVAKKLNIFKDIKDIKDEISSLKSRMNDVENDISRLKSRVSSLEG